MMKKSHLIMLIVSAIAIFGCTLDEPRAIGDKCDGVSFIWPDGAGGEIKPGDNATYDYYLNNRICPPDKPYCLTKKGVVHRGTYDENGEYIGDIVYPDEWYCSDRKENCPKGSHLVVDDAQSFCEHDSALHCGEVGKNCMDSAKGVDAASCDDGQCRVIRCLQGFTLINGECLSGAQCCGDYCKNCTLVSQAHLVCSTEDYMNFDCGEACPLSDMIECYGVCINPETNLAYCGTEAQESGNCEMHYCPDMEGWRNGGCIAGKCKVSECILGYHIVTGEDGTLKCDPDTIDVCGNKLADCNLVAHAQDVACERGLCIVKSCEEGYTLYNNECIKHTGKTCGDITCGPHMICDETTHLCKCEQGYTDCNGECYDLNGSAYHCGDCDSVCTSDKYSHSTDLACVDGICEVSGCEDGYHVEMGRCSSNTCTDGETDCIHSDKIGMVKTCNGGVWGEFVSCEGVSCNNEIENCGVCVNGTKRCEDRMLLTCINGRWQNAVECDASLVCSENRCVSCGAEAHVFGNSCEKHDVNNCGTHDTKCDASVRPNGTEFNCDTGTCKATKCASGYHVYGDGCEKDDVNNCNTHGKKCDASVIANGTGFNCDDGTCKATSCSSRYHVYNNTCELNDTDNCNAHGTKCNASNHPGGTEFNCDYGTCKATACGSGYHKYNDTCEKNTTDNCGTHGSKCNASVIANGASFNCDNGTCKVTGCSNGYTLENSCNLCYKGYDVYVAVNTKADNGVTIPMDSKITVYYKRKDGSKTDAYGRQKYKVLFSYSPNGQFGGIPTVSSMNNVWMPADYVNILTKVLENVRVDNDSPDFKTLEAGCKYSTFDRATVYGAGDCKDTNGQIEKCSYGICCADNCWGWFSNAKRGKFGPFENYLDMLPECK